MLNRALRDYNDSAGLGREDVQYGQEVCTGLNQGLNILEVTRSAAGRLRGSLLIAQRHANPGRKPGGRNKRAGEQNRDVVPDAQEQ